VSGGKEGVLRGSSFATPVVTPGPPVKRNRVATEEYADEADPHVQAFSTAKDEYVS
jgi:hypothetical protein